MKSGRHKMDPQFYQGLVNKFGRQVEMAQQISKALANLNLTDLNAFAKDGEITITADEFNQFDLSQTAFDTLNRMSKGVTNTIQGGKVFIHMSEDTYEQNFLGGQQIMPG